MYSVVFEKKDARTHTSMSETDITILVGGGEIEIGNAVPLSARRKSIHRNETEQKALFFFSFFTCTPI